MKSQSQDIITKVTDQEAEISNAVVGGVRVEVEGAVMIGETAMTVEVGSRKARRGAANGGRLPMFSIGYMTN